MVVSVSFTTRPPRLGEIDGQDYHFLSREEFESRLKADEFLEYAEVFGHLYGTSRRYVEERLHGGKHVFLVIDTQGAMQVREKIDAVTIFVSPPSLEELERRLQNRKTESAESLKRRLAWALHELEQRHLYDYHIVNDNLEIAYHELRNIVLAQTKR